MAVFELPVSELYRYTGRNERPDDFDAYWDRAIAEMESLGAECTLTPARFVFPNVECFDLVFTGVGGARIHCRYARPAKREEPLPAVCMFHGYSGDCGSFSSMLHFVAAGFAVASMSCRGQGGLSEDPASVKGNTLHGHIIRGLADPNPDKLYYRNVFLDTAQLARIVMAMPEVDASRVCATGGSQGGGLTLACAALTPNLFRAAPRCPFLCDYRRVWEMDLDVDAYAELREYFRHSDPRHEREAEIFTRLGYIDNQFLAPRIQAEILMFTGLMDPICPPSTQFAAYNRITSSKRVLLYPDFFHEDYPDQDDITLAFFSGTAW